MIEKPKIDNIDNVIQLKRKVDNLDKIIDEYTILRNGADNIGLRKSCDFFVNHMIKKKLNIEEIINEIYSSIIKMPSED